VYGLSLAYDAIWPETRLKQAPHIALATDNPDIPHPSAVQRSAKRNPVTTPAALRRKAFDLSRRRRQMPAAPRD
jgi:hypothetical protein